MALIVICLFWKLTLSQGYTWLESFDAAHQVLPWLDFQARAFHRGEFPLWDPHQWMGQSLIGQVQPGIAYPSNWLLFLMPLENGHIGTGVLHWYWVLIHVVGALNCYWLCRDLKRSRMASLMAGTAFGAAGFLGRTEWPQHLNSAIWAPLILMFTCRAWKGVRPWVNAVLSGAFLGLSFLGGHFQVPVFLSLLLAVLWSVFLLGRPKPLWRWAVAPTAAAIVAFAVGAFQILPAMEYGRYAVRWMGIAGMEPLRWDQPVPYTVHSAFALAPASLAGAVLPGVAPASGIYIGLVLAVSAVIGLGAAWQWREARTAAATSVAGVALALGPLSLFHGLAYAAFPMMEKARNPAMAVALIALGAAVAAAFGFDAIAGRMPAPGGLLKYSRRILIAFSILLAASAIAIRSGGLKLTEDIGFVVPLAAALGLAAVLWAAESGRLSAGVLTGCLLALLLWELGNSAGFYLPPRTGMPWLARYREQADLGRFFESRPGLFRADLDDEDIPYNFGDWYGIDQFAGYVASIPDATFRLQGDPRFRALAGVVYRASRKPAPGYPEEVFTSKSGIRVFRNPDALPRAWTVHAARAFSGRVDDVPAALAAPGFDLRREALVPEPLPRLEACAGDIVGAPVRTANSFRVDVEMKCRGMLIVSDPVFPGWEARVDSVPAGIRTAYGLFRAVELDAGRHRVSMRYRPAGVLLGCWLSLAGAGAAIAAAVRSLTARK